MSAAVYYQQDHPAPEDTAKPGFQAPTPHKTPSFLMPMNHDTLLHHSAQHPLGQDVYQPSYYTLYPLQPEMVQLVQQYQGMNPVYDAPASSVLEQNSTPQYQRDSSAKCTCKLNQNRIPRPRNAFILFRQKYHQLVLDELPEAKTNPEVLRELGRRWRLLPPDERNHWVALAEEEKKNHARKYPNYRYTPRRHGKNRKCPACQQKTQQAAVALHLIHYLADEPQPGMMMNPHAMQKLPLAQQQLLPHQLQQYQMQQQSMQQQQQQHQASLLSSLRLQPLLGYASQQLGLFMFLPYQQMGLLVYADSLQGAPQHAVQPPSQHTPQHAPQHPPQSLQLQGSPFQQGQVAGDKMSYEQSGQPAQYYEQQGLNQRFRSLPTPTPTASNMYNGFEVFVMPTQSQH